MCCSLITPYDVMLTGKCSQVITKFVQDERLSEQMIAFIIEWCLRSLTESPDIAQIETLTAMENILVQNVNSCKMVNTLIIDNNSTITSIYNGYLYSL